MNIYKIIFGGVFGAVLAACGISVVEYPFEAIILIILFNIALFWD